MSYYETIEKDVERAKQILAAGKLPPREIPAYASPELRRNLLAQSGTIYGQDTYAAYKLLESFVEAIETYKAWNETLQADYQKMLDERGALLAKLTWFREMAEFALVKGGQHAGSPLFVPSVARRVLEILGPKETT